MSEEESAIQITEEVVLEKFEGEPVPENLIERVFVLDGVIQRHEIIEGGEVVASREGGLIDGSN